MNKKSFGEYVNRTVQMLLDQNNLVDSIPAGILKLQFKGRAQSDKDYYGDQTFTGVAKVHTINKECISFKWYAVDVPLHMGRLLEIVDFDSGLLGSHGWKGKAPNPYSSLPFTKIVSWELFEPREAPLLMGWRYKSCAFNELFK